MGRKRSKIERAIEGVEEWSPDQILRATHWDVVRGITIPPTIDAPHGKLNAKEWEKLLMIYVKNPRYRGDSIASPEDRAQRIKLALSGGNIKGIPLEMTWKKFIEGMVILGATTLTLTTKVVRGNFGSSAIASASCRPSEELVNMITSEKKPAKGLPASVMLNRFFSDTGHTSLHVMKHILLKVLWKLFAEFKIDELTWVRLSKRYVRQCCHNIPDAESKRNDKRHNMQTVIRSTDKITWKRFLETIKAIDGRTMECTLLVQFQKLPPVEVTTNIDFSQLTLWSPNNESDRPDE
jgi:hypothetical protein